MKEKFYKRIWFIVLMLLFISPIGIYLMFKYTTWNKKLKFYLSVLSVIIFILICVTNSDDKTTQENNTAIEAQVIETNIPTENPTESPTQVPTDEPTEEALIFTPESILVILQESFIDTGTVEYLQEEETFAITPTDDAFINDLEEIINGNKDVIEAWNSMVDSISKLSKSVSGYNITVVNPVNTENTLLMVYEGYVMYDFTQD